jgi:hypothetical protein
MEPPSAPEMVAAIARPEHTVRIVFADGEVRDVDITPLLAMDRKALGKTDGASLRGV